MKKLITILMLIGMIALVSAGVTLLLQPTNTINEVEYSVEIVERSGRQMIAIDFSRNSLKIQEDVFKHMHLAEIKDGIVYAPYSEGFDKKIKEYLEGYDKIVVSESSVDLSKVGKQCDFNTGECILKG